MPSPDDRLALELEHFARDLLALIRGVRVYPTGHSFLAQVAGRLVEQVATRLPSPLAIGVTPGELTLGDLAVGGRQRRAAELAVLLHKRKVARLTVACTTSTEDLIATAHHLARPHSTGAELAEGLAKAGVAAVTLRPLQLEKIHEAFRERVTDGEAGATGRGLDAWHWLLDGEVTPGRVADLLTAEATWEPLGELAPDGEAAQLATLLFRLGDRLGEALAHLPAEQRRPIQQRLAQVGKRLAPRELALLLREADTQRILEGPLGDALEQAFGGEKLLDLLAALLVDEGRDTRRLSEVYTRLGTLGKTEEFLSAVREKLATGDTGAFTSEVWGAVESFLLSLQEAPFMGSDYSATLEQVAAASPHEHLCEVDLTTDLEPHLDAVWVGLAIDDTKSWGSHTLERLAQRLNQAAPGALLDLATELDRSAPNLLGARAGLIESLFQRCSRQVRALEEDQRQRLLHFAQRHETLLLGPVFRALLLEEQIAVRRFLVDVVAAFSPAATPAVVSRLRSSPWYVTRNLTIAMGRRREETTLPVLLSLLQHEHAKVRREAIIALGRFGTAEAFHALGSVAHSSRSAPEERNLAARAMDAAGPAQEAP